MRFDRHDFVGRCRFLHQVFEPGEKILGLDAALLGKHDGCVADVQRDFFANRIGHEGADTSIDHGDSEGLFWGTFIDGDFLARLPSLHHLYEALSLLSLSERLHRLLVDPAKTGELVFI